MKVVQKNSIDKDGTSEQLTKDQDAQSAAEDDGKACVHHAFSELTATQIFGPNHNQFSAWLKNIISPALRASQPPTEELKEEEVVRTPLLQVGKK